MPDSELLMFLLPLTCVLIRISLDYDVHAGNSSTFFGQYVYRIKIRLGKHTS